MNDALSAPAIRPLPADWQDWLVSNIARGCADADLASAMVEGGYEPQQAWIVIATVRAMAGRTTASAASGVDGAAPAAAVSGYLPDRIRLPQAASARAHDRDVAIGLTIADPNLALLDGLASPQECERLIGLAAGKLKRSEVVDGASGGTAVSGTRTSEGACFAVGENDVVDRIEQRIEALTGVPVAHGEPLQVLHYLPGGEYLAHHDYFDPCAPGTAAHLRAGGQRIATVVVYLSDVEAGGETAFPALRLSVRPRRGSAVYFEYCDRHGTVDPRCLHAGVPVSRGEKWIATKWLRQSEYRSPD